MSGLRVLIVGASIAGPTAAYWFAKAGASVTVIERFPQLRTTGQNVDIRTAGVTVMRKIPGMEATVRAKTAEMEGMSFVRSDGRPYGTIRATGNPDEQSLVSEYEIFRGDLGKILFDLTKDDKSVKYVFDEQVTSIQQSEKDGGPVKVEFKNNKIPSTDYDLVVACDGAASRTRAIGLDCGAREYVHPTNCWIAYCTLEEDLLYGSKIAQAHGAVGGRCIGLKSDPAGGCRAAFWGLNPLDNRDLTLPFREAMKNGDTALKEYIAQYYTGVGWKTEQVLQGMMKSDSLWASEMVQIRCPSLYKGRFVMVGDAGYAPGFTGTGTSLAMAGAYILAGEVGKHKGDLTAGLKGYEEQMKPLLAEMTKMPPFVTTIMGPQTAWGLWLRNSIFAIITWSRILEYAQRFFAAGFAKTTDYPLPEYQWVR